MRRNQTSNEKSNAMQPEKQAIKLAKQAESCENSNATKKAAKKARQRNQNIKQKSKAT